MRLFLALAIVLATPAVAEAKLHHEAVGYGEFEGYMAYDDAQADQRSRRAMAAFFKELFGG